MATITANPLSEISSANVDAAARLNRIAMDSAERAIAVQLEYAKGALSQATLNAKALVASVNGATTAGVPVVIFDSALGGGSPVSFVATDNRAAGALAAARLAELSPGEVLLEYWRLLFHARVDLAIERRSRDGSLTPADVRRRIHQIGQTEFDEIRSVLRQEDFLLPPRDPRMVYREFAAVYLELRHFAPSLLPVYFPSLEDPEAIDEVLDRYNAEYGAAK